MGNTIVYQDVVEIEWQLWPVITSLSDTCLTVGQALTINGANFGAVQGAGHVDFTGGGVAAITSWAAAQIVCTVPVGTTRGSVTVTNNAGETSDGYAYGMHPIISGISDSCLAVGQLLTINGSNFNTPQGVGSVSFTGGGVAAITSWNDTQIVCTVPIGTTPGDITVTNSDGCVSNLFTYGMHPIIAVLPLTGPVGTPITITGLHFGAVQGTGGVIVGGIAAGITSWSDVQVVATVPVGLPPGVAAIVLTNDDGCGSNSVNFTVSAAGGGQRAVQVLPQDWPITTGRILGQPPIVGG